MPITTEEQRNRLVDLIAWAAGEDVKASLGLPSEWNQGEWLAKTGIGCGTACCIAGKITLDDGGEPLWGSDLFSSIGDAAAGEVRMPNGEVWRVPDYARRVLGLTRREAEGLFEPDNTLDSLVDVADRLLTPSGS